MRLRLQLLFLGSSVGRNPSALDVSLAMKGVTGIMVNSGLDISFMHFGLAFWFSFGLVNIICKRLSIWE